MKPKNIDEETCRKLVEEHRRIIYKVCYLYATDEEHLKDLRQEVLINLWNGFPQYKGESQFSLWVYRVCINSCISFQRKHGRQSEHIPLESLLDTLPDEENKTARLRELYRIINRLNPMEKALILLWLDEYTYDEMAEITGLGRNTIASRLKRTKEKLVTYANR